MTYKLARARKRATGNYLKVLVNPEVEADYLQAKKDYEKALKQWEKADPESRGLAPERPEDPRIYEEFNWGLDVPKTQMMEETKRLLDEKHSDPDEEIMPEEGENL